MHGARLDKINNCLTNSVYLQTYKRQIKNIFDVGNISLYDKNKYITEFHFLNYTQTTRTHTHPHLQNTQFRDHDSQITYLKIEKEKKKKQILI